eukprot:994709-Prorocentrum_minimum.AAC.1
MFCEAPVPQGGRRGWGAARRARRVNSPVWGVGCRKEGAEDRDGHVHRYFQERIGTKDNWHARAQTRMW